MACWFQPKAVAPVTLRPIACPVDNEEVLQRVMRAAERRPAACYGGDQELLQNARSKLEGSTLASFTVQVLVLLFAHWRVEVNNSKLLRPFSHRFRVRSSEQQHIEFLNPEGSNETDFKEFVEKFTAEHKLVSFDAYAVEYGGPDAVIGSPRCSHDETIKRGRARQLLGRMLFPMAETLLQLLGEFLTEDFKGWQFVIRSAFPLVSLNMRHIFGISAKAVILGGSGASGVWVMPEEGTTVVRRSYRLVFLYEGAEHGSQERKDMQEGLAGPLTMLAENRLCSWTCKDPWTGKTHNNLWDLPTQPSPATTTSPGHRTPPTLTYGGLPLTEVTVRSYGYLETENL
eukprot:TRINITY_DN26843_c0_g1_i2.p1 TRINITY_DN26843_c0_g1~~TRINITY_DN26843_c0_g1_i2.p1  ORF type:complete len:386 (-),score=67.33 TRINITY_DN26843_c0_g1_i2:26-1054(-)